jgi:hypothetical protein
VCETDIVAGPAIHCRLLCYVNTPLLVGKRWHDGITSKPFIFHHLDPAPLYLQLSHTHARTHIHTYTRTHTHAHTYTHTRAHIHTHTRTHIHAHTHAHTQTHAHTVTHRHTHTKTCFKTALPYQKICKYSTIGKYSDPLTSSTLCYITALF